MTTSEVRTRRLRGRGYSVLELVIVAALIGILANLALPVLFEAMYKAKATAIVADFTALRHELIRYQTEQGAWPRGAGWRREPRDLRPYLEGRLRWDQGTHEYRLANRMRRPLGSRPWRLALQVRGDRRVLEHVKRIWDDDLYERRNRKYMFVNFVIAR